MTNNEVMALALDALERNVQHKYPYESYEAVQLGQAAIIALRKALLPPHTISVYQGNNSSIDISFHMGYN